ncbi:phosphodiester glycosidase family protein [Planococcus salinus]|uniref:Phosphodiester glycosidase family protein n=1 Tax=Planococcus salinus TaxID=1848460 RepID=A0A3M8P3B0_9BACL|nr:phosphodiester glycosidase family protein [Planococcus salinus]RNF38203.1 phosphodiester glycosidase family protein [Planococcus salinus]
MHIRKILSSIIAVAVISTVGMENTDAAMISQGVYHSATTGTVAGNPQRINQLSVNMNKPYTTIDLGIADPFTSLTTTSDLSRSHSTDQHHIVGAVNASLFTFENGLPTYLLADGNEIVNLGVVSTNFNDFMHTPAAFGVTSDNKAKVDEYELSYTVSHNGETAELTSLNRERQRGESILYTSSWPYPTTRTNSTGMEVVVTTASSVNTGYEFGEELTGKVTAIRPYGQYTSATIPANGFVISAVDKAEVDKIRDIKVGDTVGLTVDVESEWKGSNFMLATGPLLVQDGTVDLSIDLNSPRVTQRTARTAVAVNEDGSNAYFVTVDSAASGSTGMTLIEFANYLKSIGAYNAINLDGGGSTTMVTRKYGDRYPTLANRPVSGYERKVSAILEAVSTAPYGQETHIKVSQKQEGIVAVGASVGFQTDLVLDQYYNPLTIDQSKLVLLSVTNGIGKIEDNQFVGVKAGTGNVNATYGNAPVTIPVTVTDSIDQLIVSPTDIRLGTGEKATVQVTGVSSSEKVIFNPAAVDWSIKGEIGSLNGTSFTASDKQGTGSLVASFGSVSQSIPVHVSDQPLPLSSLDSTNGLTAKEILAEASITAEKTIDPKEGAGSVKLCYDFTSYKNGTSAAYLTWNSAFKIPGQPKKLGVWVYGDGMNHWLRGSLKDADGKEFVVDFTAEDQLNWVGWKYVEAALPNNAVAPLSLQKIYIAETKSTRKTKGSIWLDGLQAVYHSKEIKETSFTPDVDARIVETDKNFTVTFSQPMKEQFVHEKYIYVEDEFGVRQPVTVKKGDSPEKMIVQSPADGYEKGKNYRLVVTHFVPNTMNIQMTKDHITEFIVQ